MNSVFKIILGLCLCSQTLALSPLYLSAKNCPQGYTGAESHCFLSSAKFDFTTDSSLTQTYDAQFNPILSHHVILQLKAKRSSSASYEPVANAPIEIIPLEKTQKILKLDDVTGLPTKAKLTAYNGNVLKTGKDGIASFSIPIKTDNDLKTQGFWIKSSQMAQGDYLKFHPDASALKNLGKVEPALLRKMNKDLSQEQAIKTSTTLKMLMDPKYVQFDKNARVSGASLEEAIQAQKDVSKDLALQDLQNLDKQGGKVIDIAVKLVGDIVNAVVKTAVRTVVLVINTIKAAVLLAYHVLKLAGIAILTVVDAVKYVFRWDDVLRTQVKINEHVIQFKNAIPDIIEKNGVKLMNNFGKLNMKMADQVKTIISVVKGKEKPQGETPVDAETPETPVEQIPAEPLEPAQQYIVNAINTNTDKMTFEQNEKTAKKLDQQLQELEVKSEDSPKIKEAVVSARKKLTARGVTASVVSAILSVILLVFQSLVVIVAGASAVAISLFALASAIFWFVLTFEVKIPFLSDLFKRVVSNGKYDFSLLSVTTVTPAIVYTYSYMATHFGKAPYPKVSAPAPIDEPAFEEPIEEAPVDEAPVDEAPVEASPVDETTGSESFDEEASISGEQETDVDAIKIEKRLVRRSNDVSLQKRGLVTAIVVAPFYLVGGVIAICLMAGFAPFFLLFLLFAFIFSI